MDINPIVYKKLAFIENCLNKGWSVKKVNQKYVFYKKHNGSRSVFKKTYLENFMWSNLSTDAKKGDM